MNLLTDGLPDFVTINQVQYRIHTSHRNWIQFDLTMDAQLPVEDKLIRVLHLCYMDKLPPNAESAIKAAVDFYMCRALQLPDIPDEAKEEETRKRIYSFEHDAKYIYSAFLAQYRIDLTTADLHWWQFNALFQSLSDDCKFSKIMEYRAIDLSKIKDKEQKAFYRKMKAYYRIPDMRTDDERDADMLRSMGQLF